MLFYYPIQYANNSMRVLLEENGLNELANENKSLYDKIIDFFNKIVDYLKTAKQKLTQSMPEFESANLDTIYDEYINMFSKALQSASKNSTNAKSTDNGVEYSSKTTYNEFNTNAMIWAKSNSTQIGDMKILNRNGKQFVLIESTKQDEGYIELIASDYNEVKELEQLYKEQNTSFDGNANQYGAYQDGNNWDLQFDTNRANSQSNSGIPKKQQDSRTTNDSNQLSANNQKQSLKEQQLEIIQNSNPMTDEIHTGICSIDDIHTYEDVLNDSEYVNDDVFTPDYTRALAKRALKNGTITVYSSQPNYSQQKRIYNRYNI